MLACSRDVKLYSINQSAADFTLLSPVGAPFKGVLSSFWQIMHKLWLNLSTSVIDVDDRELARAWVSVFSCSMSNHLKQKAEQHIISADILL